MHLTCCVLAIGLLLVPACRERTNTANGQSSPATAVPETVRVVGGLQEPVALVFLSTDIMLVAERRAGRIRWVERGTLRAAPFATVPVPNVLGYNEHGLLGLAVEPGYPARPYVYAFHTVPGSGGRPVSQRVVRFTVQNGRGVNQQTLIGNLPASTGCCHNGGRIRFGTDGKLYVTVGDTLRAQSAQQTGALSGKVLRYNPDGSVPTDNPFSRAGAAGGQRSPVFTYGHRNPFGIAANPATPEIYITENGPDRGDEINRLVAGGNYGWPAVTGYSDDPRFRSPLWSSGNAVTAPTGAVFYTGDEFPQFRGNLLFANYVDGRLRRAIFAEPDKISAVEIIQQAGNRAKLDVAMSPDGKLYFSSMDAVYRLQREDPTR